MKASKFPAEFNQFYYFIDFVLLFVRRETIERDRVETVRTSINIKSNDNKVIGFNFFVLNYETRKMKRAHT